MHTHIHAHKRKVEERRFYIGRPQFLSPRRRRRHRFDGHLYFAVRNSGRTHQPSYILINIIIEYTLKQTYIYIYTYKYCI